MPVEFLSDEQEAAVGRLGGEVSLEDRERFFQPDDAALELVAKRRGDHNRLGFALQLTTVRFLGTFLADPLEVPWSVVDYLAAQVGVEEPSVVKRYAERPPTQWEHSAEIRQVFGYHDFADPVVQERLRTGPRRVSGPGLERALSRAAELANLGARSADVSGVPAGRLAVLARYGMEGKAQTLTRLAEPRQTATLVATARHLEAAAVDDALDLFDVLMANRLLRAAQREVDADRLGAMPQLEKASATLANVTKAVRRVLEAAGDGEVSVTVAWEAIEAVAPRHQVAAAASIVDELVPDDSAGETAMRAKLAARYVMVRPFLVLLAEAVPLGTAPIGQDLLEAVKQLPDLVGRRRIRPDEVNEDLVPPVWVKAVFANPGMPWPARSPTGNAARCGRRTAKVKKTNSAPSAWS